MGATTVLDAAGLRRRRLRRLLGLLAALVVVAVVGPTIGDGARRWWRSGTPEGVPERLIARARAGDVDGYAACCAEDRLTALTIDLARRGRAAVAEGLRGEVARYHGPVGGEAAAGTIVYVTINATVPGSTLGRVYVIEEVGSRGAWRVTNTWEDTGESWGSSF